jgi:hypothetical protein
MQRFEIWDFVCKKACIEWERASNGELRYNSLNLTAFKIYIKECALE